MAGIGFALRRLTQQGQPRRHRRRLCPCGAGLPRGPWLFTIVALRRLDILGRASSTADALALFRIIVIYDFAFSLVIAGPITMVANRYPCRSPLPQGRPTPPPACCSAPLALPSRRKRRSRCRSMASSPSSMRRCGFFRRHLLLVAAGSGSSRCS